MAANLLKCALHKNGDSPDGIVSGWEQKNQCESYFVVLTFEILAQCEDFSEQKETEQEITDETEKFQVPFSVSSCSNHFLGYGRQPAPGYFGLCGLFGKRSIDGGTVIRVVTKLEQPVYELTGRCVTAVERKQLNRCGMPILMDVWRCIG